MSPDLFTQHITRIKERPLEHCVLQPRLNDPRDREVDGKPDSPLRMAREVAAKLARSKTQRNFMRGGL